jgi:hypothetical protein
MISVPKRKKLLRNKQILITSAVVITSSAIAIACAKAEDDRFTDNNSEKVPDPPPPIPDAGEGGALTDAFLGGGGCDASESDCVAEELSCNETAWCPVPTTVSTRFGFSAVWGSSKNDVWAVGSGGTIAHYDGTNWKNTSVPSDIVSTFHAVWGSSATDVWAVSMTDTIVHTNGFTGGNAAWVRVTPAAKPDEARAALSIWGTSAEDHLRIGTRARAFFDPNTGDFPFIDQYTLGKNEDGTFKWNAVLGEGNVHGIWGSSATDVWVVADNSEKQGHAWQKGMTKHGVAPSKKGPAVDPDASASSATDLVWTEVDSQSPVTLEAIWGSSADDIWAVGDKGTIRRMQKGQTRWSIVTSPTHEALHGVWGSSANDVWAVGDAGSIFHFDGKDWKPSTAAFPIGRKPNLRGVWGSAANDVWIVGDGIALHYTGGVK